MRAEVAGEEGGELRRTVGHDLLRRRPSFGVEAGEPGRDVGQRVARRRRSSSRRARRGRHGCRCCRSGRRNEGARRPREARSRWRSAGSGARLPTIPSNRAAARGRARGRPRSRSIPGSRTGCPPRWQVGGWRRRGDLAQARQHGVDIARIPRRRPVSGRQILENDHRAFPVVMPAEHRRQERRVSHLRVEEVLVADPRRRVVAPRRLHERGRAVGELDEPVRRVRLTPTGDLTPRAWGGGQRQLDPSRFVLRRYLHEGGAYRWCGWVASRHDGDGDRSVRADRAGTRAAVGAQGRGARVRPPPGGRR